MEQGKITTVHYEDGIVYCNVETARSTSPYERVPVLKPYSHFLQIPEQGQTVVMDTLKGSGKRFILHVIERPGAYPKIPEVRESEFWIQLDPDTKIEIHKRPDEKYDIKVNASGDMHLDAEGDIFIDGTKWSTHGHPYDWTDSGGSSVTDEPQ